MGAFQFPVSDCSDVKIYILKWINKRINQTNTVAYLWTVFVYDPYISIESVLQVDGAIE